MEENHSSIESLVRRVQTGEHGSLAELVRRLERPLMGLANRILCDPIAAEDVFIESMTRLLPLVAGFGEPDRFGAYARRAVRNQAVD